MIEVLLTTLETEMSTTAVDQDQVLAEQIAKIVSKVHQSIGAPEKTNEISSEVAYRYIQYLEDEKMFSEELIACKRRKWADFLVMLPYSKISLKAFEDTLTNLNTFLTKPLLEILEI